MLAERISLPVSAVIEALNWLEVLADSNDDPRLMATIELLATRVDGWRRLELVTHHVKRSGGIAT